MRLVLQRVRNARVDIEGKEFGRIGTGLFGLIGFGANDTLDLIDSPAWEKMLDKIRHLRIFPDTQGKMNRSITDISGDIMIISQFTLYASCKKGRRPSFTKACSPENAQQLYDHFIAAVQDCTPGIFATGQFGAMMDITFTNWGPVTLILDSEEL